MSAIATAIGAAAVIGAGSSYLSGKQQTSAAHAAGDVAAAQYNVEQGQRRDNLARYQPYADYGTEGLAKARGFDLMGGVGDQPNWDKEYTDRLALYEESPGYTAQNSLARQGLARSQTARGLNHGMTAANAGEELSMKLRAGDFDKYRTELGARYGALKGEYDTRRGVNKDKYTQLMDSVKIGQGATQNMAGLASGTGALGQFGTSAANAGNAQAQATQNMGQAFSSGLMGAAGTMGGGTAGTSGSMFDSSMGLNGAGQPINNLVSQSSEGYTWPGATFGG